MNTLDNNANTQPIDNIDEESIEDTLLLELENESGLLNKKRLKEYKSNIININTNDNSKFCDICINTKSKYTCPVCKIKTCSLLCTNNHKTKDKCPGKKLLTYNKSIESNNDLMKDVKYLTTMINSTNNISKQHFNLTKKEAVEEDIITSQEQTEFKGKDKKLRNFIKLCKKFRNISYFKCPSFLSRYNENMSYCDSRNKKFYWSVKIYIINLESNSVFESFLFKEPFDDSIYSINGILEYFISNDNRINITSNQILCLLTSSNINKIRVYKKIGKVEYDNGIINKLGKELFKHNDFNYFEELPSEEREVKLLDYLNGKTVKDYLELYIKI